MPLAKVISHSGEKVVVFAVRQFLPQPIQAPGWTDLRIGWLVSIVGEVDPTDDDDPTAVTEEEIGTPPGILDSFDRFFLGVLDSHSGQVFAGFTNTGRLPDAGGAVSDGTSKLISSDDGIGADTDFWRVENGLTPSRSFGIIDSGFDRGFSSTRGSTVHFPQDTTAAGGYTTLLMMRLQRPHETSKTYTVSTKKDTTNNTANVLYTNTPTEALLTSNLIATFPSPATTIGPVTLTEELDTLYFYWPFHDSRLRVHAAGIYKAA